MINLRGRSFLTLLDFSSREIAYLLDLARDLKQAKRVRAEKKTLSGLNVCLIFEKLSTRTRCSFEVAALDQGMGAVFLSKDSTHFGLKESIVDSAKVLGRFFDGIEFRGRSHKTCEDLAKHAGVPVWNGLTDEFHPTQILADFLTISEIKNTTNFNGLKFAYFGDARNNMANSLMIGCAKMGMDIYLAGPKSLWPKTDLVAKCRKIAVHMGSKIVLTEDPKEAAHHADVIYTDVWVSMGEKESVWKERIRLLKSYQVTMDLLKMAKKDVVFLHCLPAFHDRNTVVGEEMYKKFGISEMEVTDEVFQSERSFVFEQAENRLHTIKAVMFATLSK